jgi:hypothetical protein
VKSGRTPHAGAHMETAIVEGEMSQEEADGYIVRLRSGEHPGGAHARHGSASDPELNGSGPRAKRQTISPVA